MKAESYEEAVLNGMLWKLAFKVQHANPLCPHKLHPVPPCMIELVLVLGHPFVDWDDILTHSVGLPRLDAQD